MINIAESCHRWELRHNAPCQRERWRSADRQQPITGRGGIEPPNWCPESCQGFDCGVSEGGARAVTVVQCRINRKKIR